jgi:O-antigen/teichoic acid export membrane protein
MGERKILNSFMIVTVGQTVSYALSFLRNLILARMLTRADYGLAATFALAVGMLELTSKLAVGQQVVQAKEGDSTAFLSTAHSFQLIAGAISSGLLLVTCIPMAHLFKVPEKTWAFALVALVPLFKGLFHLDCVRRQRHFEFLPSISVDLVPQVIVTALAWPMAAWIGDYRVVLVLLLGKELLTLLMARGVAQHPYRLGWDRAQVHRMWNFGWPLILNGFFMFAAGQGDQLLVGSGYSLEVLALYAAGASLIAAPFMIMAGGMSSILLPLLSRHQEDPVRFRREYKDYVLLTAIGAMVTMLPLVLAGEQILKLLYGSKYAGGGMVMAWLAAAHAFWFLRMVPSIAAMARADTQNQMISNLFRLSYLPLVLLAVLLGASVATVAACAVFGQLAALVASAWRLKRRQSVPLSDTFRPAAYLGACLAVAGVSIMLGAHQWHLVAAVGVSALLCVCALASAFRLFHESMRRLWQGLSPVLFRRVPLVQGKIAGK